MPNERPILERGPRREMPAAARADLVNRGSAKIFDPTLRRGVLDIIEDVRVHGDAGLIRALEKFGKISIGPDRIRVSPDEFASATKRVSPELLTAIRDLLDHLRSFNEQLIQHGNCSFESEPGLIVGEKATPIASAGLFVPSGKGSYPSVMAQLGTPAVVAGVQQIAVVVPPIPGGNGEVDPAVLVVAEELGIREVFRANGPAGIAAPAFGTETVPQVRKVCGPGSPPVTCAQVEIQRYGAVSVMLLGPSESLILADDSADPYFLAADLLNEAEHGADSTSVLVTDSQRLVDATQAEVAKQLIELPADRAAYAREAVGVNGEVVLTSSIEEAADVANVFAPEHMQIAVRDVGHVLDLIVNAGEILLGQQTTVSMANFVIGCPAALPTGGYARVSSGITADAFRKRTAIARATHDALDRMSATVIAFARHEGFAAHEFAVTRRLIQR